MDIGALGGYLPIILRQTGGTGGGGGGGVGGGGGGGVCSWILRLCRRYWKNIKE